MLRLLPLLAASVLLAALAVACDGDGADETPAAGDTPGSSPVPAPTPLNFTERPEITIDPDTKLVATVETVKGTFRIELRPDIAIQTVNSFVFLARQGYYDGVTFHRVIPGFMAQGGDPTGTGSGDPGYTLPAEFSDEPYERGTVGMARANDPNSGGSQFFVTYVERPDLNGKYTVFGKVVEGMEVVDALTPRDPANFATPQPDTGDQIITIEIEEVE
jgi:peptidylprolyl isomerase